jgi:hypothetical protein
MAKTPQTPHAAAVEGGGTIYLSHADYLDWLYRCAEAWQNKGERAQANLVRRKILTLKRQGERRCPVCRAQQ